MARKKEHEKHKMKHHEGRQRRAAGGEIDRDKDEFGDGMEAEDLPSATSYTGKSHVTEEAEGEMRKHGGKVKRAKRKEGGTAYGGDAKKAVKRHIPHIEGGDTKERLDRPKRKTGGAVGADYAPLTTAARFTDRRGPSEKDDGEGITGAALGKK